MNWVDPAGLFLRKPEIGHDNSRIVHDDGRTPRGGGGPQEQSRGGGKGAKVVKISVDRAHLGGPEQSRINSALDWLVENIDEDCQRWLETGATTSFGQYVAAALPHIGWGVISTTKPNSIVNAVTAGAAAGGDGSATSLQLAIVINSQGAFFNFDLRSGEYQGRAAQINILLHEFGHSNEVPGFEADKDDELAGIRNNQTVEKNCAKTLNKLL